MAMMVDILPGDLREQVREREEKQQQQQQQQQSSLCVIIGHRPRWRVSPAEMHLAIKAAAAELSVVDRKMDL